MGKKQKSSAGTAGESSKSAAMAASIDDIFASKPKAGPSAPSSSSAGQGKQKAAHGSATFGELSNVNVATKKQRKKPPAESGGSGASSVHVSAGKEVETVVDPSTMKPMAMLPARSAGNEEAGKKKGKRERKDVEDDEDFADSRGTGPSKSRLKGMGKANRR